MTATNAVLQESYSLPRVTADVTLGAEAISILGTVMNILLGTFVGLLLIYLIAYTDFVLSRKLKQQVAQINDLGRQGYSFRPLNWPLAAGLALFCWALPGLLPRPALYLEYRILLTLLAWTAVAGALYWYLRHRTDSRLARRALSLLLGFALAAGLLLAPLFNLLYKILAW